MCFMRSRSIRLASADQVSQSKSPATTSWPTAGVFRTNSACMRGRPNRTGKTPDMNTAPPASSPAPVKRTKIVQVEYWDCGISTHNHQTESVAAACMAKRRQRCEHKSRVKQLDIDRIRQSIQFGKRIIGGEPFTEIAEQTNRSHNRVRQVFFRLIREAASGQFGGKTILAPAKHLAYGAKVAAIRGNAEAWLKRLAEIETALVQQQAAPR